MIVIKRVFRNMRINFAHFGFYRYFTLYRYFVFDTIEKSKVADRHAYRYFHSIIEHLNDKLPRSVYYNIIRRLRLSLVADTHAVDHWSNTNAP